MLSMSSLLLITSFFSFWQMPDNHTVSRRWVSPGGRAVHGRRVGIKREGLKQKERVWVKRLRYTIQCSLWTITLFCYYLKLRINHEVLVLSMIYVCAKVIAVADVCGTFCIFVGDSLPVRELSLLITCFRHFFYLYCVNVMGELISSLRMCLSCRQPEAESLLGSCDITKLNNE